MNGGYVILSCGGIDITDDKKQTIDGLYADIATARATGKPVYAYDLTGVSPVNVYITDGESDALVINFGTVIITVDTSDGATVTSAIPAPETKRTTTKKE